MTDVNHSFSVADAEKFGLPAAVILHNIKYWLHFNLQSKRNILEHEGATFVWTYMTSQQICEQMPYFTQRVIKKKLTDLVEIGALIRAQLSKDPMNRVYFYTIPSFRIDTNRHIALYQTVQSEMGKLSNDNLLNAKENATKNPIVLNGTMECTERYNVKDIINKNNENNINNINGGAVSKLDSTKPLQRAVDHNFRFKGIVDNDIIASIWFDFVEHAKLHYTSCDLNQLLAKLNSWISNSKQHLQNQKNLYKKGIGNGASNRKQNAAISAVERRYRANGGTGDPDRDLENLPDW